MNTHTHGLVVPVKQKEQSRLDMRHFRRAQRALLESPLVPIEESMLFLYLLSLQGTKSHAFPSLNMLAQRFGSKPRAIRLIKSLLKLLPDVFEVTKSQGRRRTSYKCTDFDVWPMNLVVRLENAKPRKPRKRTVVDIHHERITQIANCNKSLPQETEPVVTKRDHYMESMEKVVNVPALETKKEGSSGDPEAPLCHVCNEPAAGGFDYKGIWVCQPNSPCHQDAYEASALPF